MPLEQGDEVVQVGEWLVDPALDTISRGTETQKLEPRTMRLLICLVNSAGAVVSVERLLTEVWSGVVVGTASVYQAVSQLRKLLGDVDADPTYIVNVPRKGYRLIAPVKEVDARPPTKVLKPDSALLARGSPSTSPSTAPPPTPSAPPSSPSALSPQPAAWRHTSRIVLGLAFFLVMALLGSLLWKRVHPPGRLGVDAASIVVLPFIDLTAERAEQAFCDGLTEELSNWLSQIPTLRVVARTSAFAFRGQGEDVRRIGKALDTNHILEGSVRRSGDHMRITVQLIDARNGYHLWSENFDRPLGDTIDVQEDISRSVAGTLQVRLTSEAERQFAARRTANPQADQWYLLGRHYAQQMTAESTQHAIDLFQQVVAADRKFAPAYTQLAYARLNEGYFHDLPIDDVAAQIEPLIASALRIDDRMSAAYAVRGALRAAQSRTGEGLDDLQHAILLNPSDMGAWAELGRIRLFGGQPREALASYDRASALDPLNYTLQEQRCMVLTDLASYPEAENACERARQLHPDGASPADGLAWLAQSRGRIDDALRWNAASVKAEPADDFDHYWTRAAFFLTVGLAQAAREAVEAGRKATKNDADADAALVRVVYCEGGPEALRRYLQSAHLEQSTHAFGLFEAAYAHLLLGDAHAARELISRALAARDRIPGFAEWPYYARGANNIGGSYAIDLAVADLALGDRPAALRKLDAVRAMLDAMIAAGVERNATYELRAQVNALEAREDDAMRDFATAVRLGWRRVWWANHEPYLASLRRRSDFQALLAQVSRSNDQLLDKIKSAN